MVRYLIVQACGTSGRGARGLNLLKFLRTWHPSAQARQTTVAQLSNFRSSPIDTLFIGLPTELTKEDLAGIRYQRAVLFDYSDVAPLAWSGANRELLGNLTNLCLRPWLEPQWNFGIQLGVLPIRRYQRLSVYLKAARWFRSRTTQPRDYDVAFVGSGTGYYGEGAWENAYHQRIEWLREMRQQASQLSFWGGLVTKQELRRRLTQRFGDLSEIYYPGKRVGFLKYITQLQRARVALAPTGNARWSYRHYEAIYAGAVPVTTDFRQIKTLIPLPTENMVHVPDHAPVVPAIEQALQMRRQRPEIVQESVDYLENVLHFGDYHRSKPRLLDEFEAQLKAA